MTKTRQLSGTPESVSTYDPLVAALLYLFSQTLLLGAQLWRGSPQDFCDEFRRHLGGVFMDAGCLRRGGATAHYIELHHLESTRPEAGGTLTVLASSTLLKDKERWAMPSC